MHVVDRQLQVFEDFDRKLRERIRKLITPELIAEHEAEPQGQHSDSLERVLSYFRRQPNTGKYVIVAVTPWQDYRIGVLSGRRGSPATLLEDESFPTEKAARHGVFLRRIQDLQEG